MTRQEFIDRAMVLADGSGAMVWQSELDHGHQHGVAFLFSDGSCLSARWLGDDVECGLKARNYG